MNEKSNHIIRQLAGRQRALEAQLKLIAVGDNAPLTPEEEIDAIPGRRIFYTEVAKQDFNIAGNLGKRSDPLTFTISQDGPWIQTHYPMVAWKPNVPDNATNFGRWSPVSSWPLPDQQNADIDVIDISYEFYDGGSQRAFQNESAPPIFSRPDNMVKLPKRTMYAPSSNIAIYITYEAINYSPNPAVLTAGGQLVVGIPGYRIISA